MQCFSGNRQGSSWNWGATSFLPLCGPLASVSEAVGTIMAWTGGDLTQPDWLVVR